MIVELLEALELLYQLSVLDGSNMDEDGREHPAHAAARAAIEKARGNA